MTFQDLLSKRLEGVCKLSHPQLELMEEHYRLLVSWNEKINLTTVVEIEEAVTRHYCESVFVAAHLSSEPGLRIADVGSGGGFPGIPIAIARPDLQIDLIESRHRKAAFLREATRDLSNVRVLAKRAEECGEEYDWMVSRAVALADLLSLRLATQVALLVGRRDAIEICRNRAFLWREPILLPWGTNRVLMIGRLRST